MKTHTPEVGTWAWWTDNIKEAIQRTPTEKEYSLLMSRYVLGVKWESMVDELNKSS